MTSEAKPELLPLTTLWACEALGLNHALPLDELLSEGRKKILQALRSEEFSELPELLTALDSLHAAAPLPRDLPSESTEHLDLNAVIGSNQVERSIMTRWGAHELQNNDVRESSIFRRRSDFVTADNLVMRDTLARLIPTYLGLHAKLSSELELDVGRAWLLFACAHPQTRLATLEQIDRLWRDRADRASLIEAVNRVRIQLPWRLRKEFDPPMRYLTGAEPSSLSIRSPEKFLPNWNKQKADTFVRHPLLVAFVFVLIIISAIVRSGGVPETKSPGSPQSTSGMQDKPWLRANDVRDDDWIRPALPPHAGELSQLYQPLQQKFLSEVISGNKVGGSPLRDRFNLDFLSLSDEGKVQCLLIAEFQQWLAETDAIPIEGWKRDRRVWVGQREICTRARELRIKLWQERYAMESSQEGRDPLAKRIERGIAWLVVLSTLYRRPGDETPFEKARSDFQIKLLSLSREQILQLTSPDAVSRKLAEEQLVTDPATRQFLDQYREYVILQ